jgi:hypothetical protein
MPGKKRLDEGRITFAQLVQRVMSNDISVEEYHRYFNRIAFPGTPGPHPINRAAVDLDGSEVLAREIGAGLRRQAQDFLKGEARGPRAPKPNGTVIAEGDSWFNLPGFYWPPTLMDFMAEHRPINNIAMWGDTFESMLADAQYLDLLASGKVTHLLWSGGGNDLVGETNSREFARYVRQRNSGDNDPANAIEYILMDQLQAFMDRIRGYLTLLLWNIGSISPETILVVHGYDYPRPVGQGPWMGQALESKGFHPPQHAALCDAIMAIVIDKYNSMLEGLVTDFRPQLKYVNLRGIVQGEWFDELHPKETAARRLAAEFEKHAFS